MAPGSLAGKTINAVAVNQEGDTAVGSWAIIYEQVSLVGADGSVHPIYTGQNSSPLTSNLQSGGETGIGSSIDVNRGHAIYPTQTTTYYTADHLGSSRLISSGNGYPVWSGVFMPFGQEWNPQITMNTYKFTGDEHDSESNLEHTWFRQYEGTQGRWLSPDPAGIAAADLTNPQSLNLYAYVSNNPMSFGDPLGLYKLTPCGLAGNCAPSTGPGDYGPSNSGTDPGPPNLIYLGGSHPRGGPGGQSGPAPNTNSTASCAVAFGDKYSIASGIKALGNGMGVNLDNAVVNGLFGNDVSAFSNLLFGPSSGRAAVGLAVSNPTDYNAVAVGVKAVGMVPNPIAAQTVVLGFTSNGAAYGAELVTPTIAESALGKVAGRVFAQFTAGKLIWDTATYATGLVSCSLKGQ